MLYNQTWAGELGYSQTPTSAAAFQMQACASVEANGGYTGGWMIDDTQSGAAAWLLAYARTLEKSGQYRFEADEVREALTFLAGISGEGCAWQPNDPYPDENFIDRQGLFYPVNTREITYVGQAFEDSDSTDIWAAIGYPNSLGESIMSVHGQSYVIVRSSRTEQLAAWLAIQSLTSTKARSPSQKTTPISPSAAQPPRN